MKKRWTNGVCLLLATVLLLLSCVGCADSGGSGQTTSASTTQTEADAQPTDTTQEHEAITIYSAQMNYTYLIQALKEKYPEINLQVLSYKGGNSSGFMKQQLTQGDIPDIYTTNYRQDEALQQEYLLDLSSYGFINNYSDTMLDNVDVDGAVYLLPSRYQVSGINYNKTMFEEHGWEVPQSFEELQALVAQIEEEAPEITPVMARMNLKGFPFQYLFALGSTDFLGTPAGAQWKSDFLEGNATAVGNLESTVAYLQKWIDAGYITDYNLDGTDFMSDFYDGKVAMVLGTSTSRWTGVGKTTGETIEVGIMAWPGENGNHGMLLSNVARYYGLSKELAQPGNEQKLEDALKVLEFISTNEGQLALCSGSLNGMAFPFKDFTVDEDSPLYEVNDYIQQGYTTPLVYEKWEAQLLVPMADELIRFIQGEIDGDELLQRFDQLNETAQNNPEELSYAILDEDLTIEQAGLLTAIALAEYTQADVGLVSVGGITDDGNYLENSTGVQCGIYACGVTEEVLNIFRPFGTKLAVIDLTGAEIKELVSTGRELYADPEAIGTEYTYLEAPVTYYMPYMIAVRNDAELEDDQVYRVAFSASDYSDRIAAEWGDRLEIIDGANTATALIAWLEQCEDGHFDASDLIWR